MSSYAFDFITLNHRMVRTADIRAGNATACSEFEQDTIDFIKQWLSHATEFRLHTSGSTGQPKQISIHRRQMESSAIATIEAFGLKPHTQALVCLPTKYIAGKMMLVRAMVNQMPIVALEPSSNPLEHVPDPTPIHLTAMVPLQIQTIIDSGFASRLNHIPTVLIGGAAIPSRLKEKMKKHLHTRVIATYGMTETISHVAYQDVLTSEEDGEYTVLPGIRIDIDSRGCLVIRANYLDQPVITNDLCTKIDDKTFRWLGRIDHVINTGGVKVIPEIVESAVEKAFTKLHIEQRFFAGGVNDEKLGQAVQLFIEGKALSDQTKDKLKHELTKYLTEYQLPKKIIYVEKFPETPTGKVNKSAFLSHSHD